MHTYVYMERPSNSSTPRQTLSPWPLWLLPRSRPMRATSASESGRRPYLEIDHAFCMYMYICVYVYNTYISLSLSLSLLW